MLSSSIQSLSGPRSKPAAFSKELLTAEDGPALLVNLKSPRREPKHHKPYPTAREAPSLQTTLKNILSQASAVGTSALWNFIAVIVTPMSSGSCFPFLCCHILELPPGKTTQQSEAERSHFAGIDTGGENSKRVFLKMESSGIPKASGCEEQL